MTSRLNATTGRLSPAQIAQKEAEAIDQLSGQLDLRLHIVGDCRTRRAAQITATASERYIARSHRYGSPRKVWTYTHAWRKVERSDWKSVSVLASCETTEDVRHARSKGYATAIVVDKFKKKSAYEIAEGLKVIPCPQQTTGVTCVECRLCMKDQHLKDRNLTIAFEAHSISKQKVKDKLMTLNMVNDS